jgi:hypothetical protein
LDSSFFISFSSDMLISGWELLGCSIIYLLSIGLRANCFFSESKLISLLKIFCWWIPFSKSSRLSVSFDEKIFCFWGDILPPKNGQSWIFSCGISFGGSLKRFWKFLLSDFLEIFSVTSFSSFTFSWIDSFFWISLFISSFLIIFMNYKELLGTLAFFAFCPWGLSKSIFSIIC